METSLIYYLRLLYLISSLLQFQPNSVKMIDQPHPQQLLALDQEFNKLPPQVKIYNRNFYVRRDEHEHLLKEREREIYQLSSRPKVSAESYSILTHKLEKELAELLNRYCEDQKVDFQHFHKIVQELGKFDISNRALKRNLQQIITQLWLLLVQYDPNRQQIESQNIEKLLIILFCPHSLRQQEIIQLLGDIFPDLEASRMRYVEEYPQGEDEILSLDELVQIWLKIKHTQFATVKKQLPQQVDKDSFRPRINSKSRQYAERSLQKYLSNNRLDNIKDSKLNELSGYISSGRELSYHEILYKRGLEKQQMMKTSREQVETAKQKTMTAEEVKRLVSNLYINKERREDVDHGRIKEEEELKLCTFKPNTIAYHKNKSEVNVKNYGKEIERLEKGRKEKQKKKEAFDNLGKVKNKNCAPPSFIEREKPRLILEIKVGERIEQLKLKGDQDPKIVAKKFILKYGLPEEMQQVLQSIVEEQLASL